MHDSQRTPPLLRLLPAFALALVAACGASSNGGDGPSASASSPGENPAPGAATNREAPRPRSGEAWVIFGADTVVAEVARSPAEREQGLKDRDEVPDGTGMLFVFEDERVRQFWMRDTYVPLDIAYLNADFRIVSIHPLEPLNEEPVSSEGPAMFALEVRQGWFAEHGIEAGDTAEVIFGG